MNACVLRRVGLITLLLMLVSAPRVDAHAALDSTDPPAGAVLDRSPEQIVLQFSERVDTLPDSIRLIDAAGTSVQTGEVSQAGGDQTISVSVPPLADGTYLVAWRAVSADSHPVNGAFTFSVGIETATTPGLLEDLQKEHINRTAQTIEGAGRWATWLGLTAALGMPFNLAVCGADLARQRRTDRLAIVGTIIAAAGTVVAIGGQAWLTVDEPWNASAWWDVMTSISGRWWSARLALLVVLVAVQAFRHKRPAHTDQRPIILVGVALLLVTAAGGHGISGRWNPAGYAATVVHLAGMCAWFGGLITIAFVVPRANLWQFLTRFSTVALAAITALTVTGLFNAWRQGVTLDDVTATGYGKWLIIKLSIVTMVIAIAAANRWVLRHGARDDAPALRRTVVVEVIGAVLILASTAGLTASPPPTVSAASTFTTNVVQGDRVAQIVLDPPVSGGTTMHVTVYNVDDPNEDPVSLTVSASSAAAGIDGLDIPMTAIGFDHLTTSNANLPIPGLWTISVHARYGEFDETIFTTDVAIR